MYLLRTYTCFLVISIVKDAVSQCAQNSNGVQRFGSYCKHMCHCVNNEQCDVDTGECSNGCAVRWFGPSCQFWDNAVGVFSTDKGDRHPIPSRFGTDGNSSTCSYTYNSSPDPGFWRVSYTDNVTFTDFRILTAAFARDNLVGFRVVIEYISLDVREYFLAPATDVQLCFQHDWSSIISNEIYFSCDQPLQGNTARIILAKQGSAIEICDFNVNGGRNLAFLKSAQQYPDGANSAEFAVDGSRLDTGWEYCSVTGETTHPWWAVNIGSIAYIQSIRITKYDNNTLGGFTVETRDAATWKQIVYDNPQISGIQTFLNITPPVRLRELQIQRSEPGVQRLILCEVETYGDCLENMCGLDCNIPCHCQVSVTMANRLSADCGGHCAGRWTGTDGRCDTECSNTQWGPSCEKTCGNCAPDNGCDLENGHCLHGCQDGYYGDMCIDECGHCKDGRACSQGDAQCNAAGCEAGYKHTDTCMEECDDYTYGVRCESNCSANCMDVCDKVIGTCSTCKTGYTGRYCAAEYSESTTKATQNIVGTAVGACVAGVVVTLAIVVITCIVYRRRKAHRNSSNTGKTGNAQPQLPAGTQGSGTDTRFTPPSSSGEVLGNRGDHSKKTQYYSDCA